MPRLRSDIHSHLSRHPLSRDQVRALRSIQHGQIIPERHTIALVRDGYAKVVIGGLKLTEEGRARLAMEMAHG